jgi:D-alanyl-D-alanine carboxypeptidase
MQRHLVVVLGVLCAAAFAAAQAPASGGDPRKRLQDTFTALHAAAAFPGGTAGVVLPDGEVIELAVGVSDRTARTPMKPDDRLMMGSIGKTFASAVALQLVHEKKIALEDRLEKWLGKEAWFARLPNAKDITIRHLMTHTSGLVRYEFKPEFTADLKKDPDRVWKPEDLLAYLFDTTAAFAPGQGWDYSDTNYIVVGMIIERATKSTY